MNCPNCRTENENDNIFCVSCGGNLAPPLNSNATTQPSPTQYFNAGEFNRAAENAPESVQTAFPPSYRYEQQSQNFNPSIPDLASTRKPKSNAKFIWLGVILFFLLLGGGIGAFFILNKPTLTNNETLPDHLGMFLVNKDSNNLSELSKQDSINAISIKEDLLKNDSLPATEDKPNFILYSDGKDIPLGDLKLVQLDSIKDDGSLKQINFQAVPIDGKPEMKRLRTSESLANGKYAFALFEGFLDEGKHKFWAFQIKNVAKSDNADLAKALTVSLKPKTAPPTNSNSNANNINAATPTKPAPTPKPEPVVPAGARVAYCDSTNVIVRNSPSLTAKKINGLKRGQKIYVLNYSDNYDSWNGMEGNWAYVQTETGSRGWVFAPLIGY